MATNNSMTVSRDWLALTRPAREAYRFPARPLGAGGDRSRGKAMTAAGHASGITWKGVVSAIHITQDAAGPMVPVSTVRAVPGRGLDGDRYFHQTGTYSTRPGTGLEVTLIEAESVEALGREAGILLAPGASRRNITTRGVPLNHLVGRQFRVGDVLLEGVRLCEPCGHLESLTQTGVREGLNHRGGLRARIVTEGTLRIGDPIQPVVP